MLSEADRATVDELFARSHWADNADYDDVIVIVRDLHIESWSRLDKFIHRCVFCPGGSAVAASAAQTFRACENCYFQLQNGTYNLFDNQPLDAISHRIVTALLPWFERNLFEIEQVDDYFDHLAMEHETCDLCLKDLHSGADEILITPTYNTIHSNCWLTRLPRAYTVDDVQPYLYCLREYFDQVLSARTKPYLPLPKESDDDKIEELLDNSDWPVYCDFDPVLELVEILHVHPWVPVSTGTCDFCSDPAEVISGSGTLRACDVCHSMVQDREYDLFGAEDFELDPIGQRIFELLVQWFDRHFWLVEQAAVYFDEYGIQKDMCEICHGSLRNDTTDLSHELAVAPTYKVAHLRCTEGRGFPEAFTPRDYRQYLDYLEDRFNDAC